MALDFMNTLPGVASGATGGSAVSNLTALTGGAVSGDLSGNEWATGVGSFAGGAVGSAFGVPPEIGGKIGGVIGGLFGGKKTDAVKQSADINTIAATNRVTPDHAAAVIAWHTNHSSDRFNDLAAFVVTTNSRFSSLLDEYNAANPTSLIYVGEVTMTGAAAVQGLGSSSSALPNSSQTAQLISEIVASGSHDNKVIPPTMGGGSTKDNMTKYALFGGGALVLLIALILLLKK